MGLGKTIQSLTFSNEVFLYGIKGPFLVVAPLSTIANWQREYETWTEMNVITYHGRYAQQLDPNQRLTLGLHACMQTLLLLFNHLNYSLGIV